MKKIFISVPMRDRTDEEIKEDIEKIKSMITAYIGHKEEIKFIDNFVKYETPTTVTNKSIWYLGEALKLMAECDIVALPNYLYKYKGCVAEAIVANLYEKEIIYYGKNCVYFDDATVSDFVDNDS